MPGEAHGHLQAMGGLKFDVNAERFLEPDREQLSFFFGREETHTTEPCQELLGIVSPGQGCRGRVGYPRSVRHPSWCRDENVVVVVVVATLAIVLASSAVGLADCTYITVASWLFAVAKPSYSLLSIALFSTCARRKSCRSRRVFRVASSVALLSYWLAMLVSCSWWPSICLAMEVKVVSMTSS